MASAELSPNIIRKLSFLCARLIKPQNFVIPETIEEYKQLGCFAAKIKVDNTEAFFNKEAKDMLKEFLHTLYELPQIKSSISFETVYKHTLNLIGNAVSDQLVSAKKPETTRYTENLIEALLSEPQYYQIFRRIEGLDLSSIRMLSFGDIDLFLFTEAHEKEMAKYRRANNSRDFYDNYIKKFIHQNYIGKACIRTIARGDSTTAKEIAYKKFKQAINLLRFIVCLLAHERIHENSIKINLMSEAYNSSERRLQINMDSHIISMDHGPDRKPLHCLPIDNELIMYLKEKCNYDEWIAIIEQKNKTELETAILNAVYWIGEAQNEYDREIAFVKYWTALETLFSVTDANISTTLAKGVATSVVFGGFVINQTENLETAYKATNKLYKKRCKIIHRGIYELIDRQDIVDICKYSVWCVLSCLTLRKKGYKTLEQIRAANDKLYRKAKETAS